MIIDPRTSVIKDRLKDVKRIIITTGFKGGIGKSLISTLLAVSMKEAGLKTALLDLDITSSTDHLILGTKKKLYPSEDKGLIPPEINGINFMSFNFFSMSKPLALRGTSISDAIKELFCVVLWGELDFLIIDMPAGFSDVALELMKIIENPEIIAISTPSPLSKTVLKRIIKVYRNNKVKRIYNVENMAVKMDKKYFAKIFYDKKIDGAIGNISLIKKTNFYRDIKNLRDKLLKRR